MIETFVKVGVYRLHKDAKLPIFTREGDACADLFSIEDTILSPGVVTMVRTGIALAIPEGFEAQIRSRSSLPLKNTIIVANGVGTVDTHYTDEVGVLLLNLANKPFKLDKGTRMAQVAIRRSPKVEFNEMTTDEYEMVKQFSRGGGFGSTGEKEVKKLGIKKD